MNIVEFLGRNIENFIYKDSYGNLYLDAAALPVGQELSEIMGYGCSDYYYLTAEEYRGYSEYQILAEAEKEKFLSVENTRRPYYRMRGKRLTENQAFEIIRRTDNFFRMLDSVWEHEDFIGCINFDNWIIPRNRFSGGYGWIHRDGTMGVDAITKKYPSVDEIVREWFQKLKAFPELELVIALTAWNEKPWELLEWESEMFQRLRWWEGCGEIYLEKLREQMEENRTEAERFDREFFQGVEYGVYIHGKKIELLNSEDTKKVYQEYDALYSQPREKYLPEYYEKSGMIQADLSYLKRCIAAYGLDAEKELSRLPESMTKVRC